MIDPHAAAADQPPPPRSGFVRAPQDFVAGLVLLALTGFVFWAVSDLAQGTMRSMGPAMIPRILAVGLGVCGALLVISSLREDGPGLLSWGVRGPLFIFAALITFAFTIQNFGLIIAGPLTMIIGGFATPEAKWKELVVFAVVMTAFCVGLFKYALGLSIPVLNLPGLGLPIL